MSPKDQLECEKGKGIAMLFVTEKEIESWKRESFESLFRRHESIFLRHESIGKENEIGTENEREMWTGILESLFILEIEVTLLSVEGWKKKKIDWNLHQIDQCPLSYHEEAAEEALQVEAFPPGQVERGQGAEEVVEVGDSNSNKDLLSYQSRASCMWKEGY